VFLELGPGLIAPELFDVSFGGVSLGTIGMYRNFGCDIMFLLGFRTDVFGAEDPICGIEYVLVELISHNTFSMLFIGAILFASRLVIPAK